MRYFTRSLQILLLLALFYLPAYADISKSALAVSQSQFGENQTTDTVMMVSPDDFGFNAETAGSNLFQNRQAESANSQKLAMREFNDMIAKLKDAGIKVIRIPSRSDIKTPDSVFPNNWFSLHVLAGGERILVGYPMLAPNRRAERRLEQFQNWLAADGKAATRVIDLSDFEQQGKFLEGTGSMVLDRANRVAYAALSPRTDNTVLLEFSKKLGYRPVTFVSNDRGGTPVYHTNVVMSVGSGFAVICAESISDIRVRDAVLDELRNSGKQVITITAEQMGKMCGNILELRSPKGPIIVMSQTAYDNFSTAQRRELESFGRLLPVRIPTIETIGGGSARCMLGEVF